MMNIYILDLSTHTNNQLLNFYNKCPLYRKEKVDRAKNFDDKLRLLGSEIVIQHGLCNENIPYDELSFSDSGKPVITSNKAFLSITHSGNICAAAFSDSDVGIDAELILSYNPKFASRFFSPAEQLLIDKSPDKDVRFTEIWTKKEALFKALPTCELALAELSVEKDLFSFSDMHYALSSFVFKDYIFSVCRKSYIDDIKTFTVSI